MRDGAGRTIAQIDALGHASRMVYDQVTGGLLVTQGIDALNHASESHSDAAGLTRKSVDALGKISTASFDANGNRISYRDADGVGLDCVMDARNRDTTCTDTGSPAATTSKTFDSDGNVITATDALGKVTTVAYDARGRKTTTTDRINAVTAFTYDAVSNLKKIVDADSANGITQYYYDDRNLLTREEFPTHVAGTNPGQVGNDAKTYTYDAGRRLTSRTDQAGVVTSYAYDNANRLKTRGYPDSLNDTFTYDPASRLVSAASARYTNTVARSYDAAGRLISEGLTTNGQTYATQSGYDNANRRTSITYPNGQVISRAYSDRNQLSDIWYGAQTPSNRALTRTYTDAGRLFISNFGNNRTELRSYLTDGLTNAMVTPGVTNFTYGYDANKRKTQETNGIIPNNSQTFSYDFQDRLTNWTRLSGDAQNWSLSLVGDWNSTTGSKNGSAFSETRTHNAVHELTAINSSPLGYDFKGNLTQDQTSKLYTWDQENRLKQAVIPAGLTDGSTAGTHTYQYDALGRRVAKVVAGAVTVFAHDGAQVIAEYTGTLNPSNPARIQVWGDYIDELILHINAGQKYYAHVNHLYSVEALTDTAGTVVERYRYDAYGSQKVYSGAGVARSVSLFNQKSGFTGRYLETESQLWFFRTRYFSVAFGRFINRTPWGYIHRTIHLYDYCSNDPINFIEPFSAEIKAYDLYLGNDIFIPPWSSREPRDNYLTNKFGAQGTVNNGKGTVVLGSVDHAMHTDRANHTRFDVLTLSGEVKYEIPRCQEKTTVTFGMGLQSLGNFAGEIMQNTVHDGALGQRFGDHVDLQNPSGYSFGGYLELGIERDLIRTLGGSASGVALIRGNTGTGPSFAEANIQMKWQYDANLIYITIKPFIEARGGVRDVYVPSDLSRHYESGVRGYYDVSVGTRIGTAYFKMTYSNDWERTGLEAGGVSLGWERTH